MVDRSGGCWLWTGALYPSGYGQFWLGGRNMTAHRASYLMFIGPLGPREVVCHRCDVKGCVRPEHLFSGSQADNITDKTAKGRQAKGSSHGMTYLDEPRVAMIKALYRKGHSQASIGRAFGVSRNVVWAIVHGKVWTHVE